MVRSERRTWLDAMAERLLFGDATFVAGRRSGKTDVSRWLYGTSRRKPAERCAAMGDGIEVVRGVVVE